MAQLFSDDFLGTDAQEIRLRSGWLEHGNTTQRNKFVISANQMNAVGGGVRGYFVGKDTASNDHWVKAKIVDLTTSIHYICARVTLVTPWVSGVASLNHVYCQTNTAGTFLSVSSRVGGTLGTAYTLNSANSTPGAFPLANGDSIELRIQSGILTVWKNSAGGSGGVQLGTSLNMDMTGVPASGVAGFLSDSIGLFDDFAVGDFTAGNSIGVTSPGKVVCRSKGSTSRSSLPVAGTFTGTAPAHIQYRVTSAGSPLSGLDWQTVGSESIGSGVWSGTTGAIPQGGPYVVDVRKSDDTGITGSSSTFYVGAVGVLYGQSNATRQVSEVPTVAITPAAGCFYKIHGGGFTQGNVSVQQLPNKLSSLLGGIPVALLCEGLGGTAISLLTPGNAAWDTGVETAIADAGGDIEFFYMAHGESDVATASTTYKAALDTCYSRLKTITGRTGPELLWLTCQIGANNAATTPDAASDPLWSGMRTTQADWSAATSGAYLAATTTDLAHFDDLHYTNDAYVILNDRVAKSYAYLLGAVANDGRGPTIGNCSVVGSTVTVNVNLNGATSLTKATGATATGWQVSTDDFATTLTVSNVQISGATVVITLASAPVGTVKVRHLYYADPDLSNVIKGTGYSMADVALAQSLSNQFSGNVCYVGSTLVSATYVGSVPATLFKT